MPTGYTAKLHDGKPQSFPEFLFDCARAFGALVTMRDAPADAPIPDKFEPSTSYYDETEAAARKTLEHLDSLSPHDAVAEAMAEYRAELDRRVSQQEKKAAIKARYEAMIEQVEAWEAPTVDHLGLQKCMFDQLRESIEFDCSDSSKYEAPLPPTGAQEWVEEKRQQAERDLAYAAEHRAKELERTRQRNAWVKALRESVQEVSA